MNKRKIISMIIMAMMIAVIAAGSICSSAAGGVNVFLDFEENATLGTPLYNNANLGQEVEPNGNNYLSLVYTGQGHPDRKYCDVKVTDVPNTSKLIQAEYDVKYFEPPATRDNEIHFKYRTGPGSAQTTMVARLAAYGDYLQIQTGERFELLKDLNGNNFEVTPFGWYSVKMIVDLDKNEQNIYVFDRDTQELLAYREHATTINDIGYINMITFTTSYDMGLDNVKIFEPEPTGICIYGKPYLTKGESARYRAFAADSSGNIVVIPQTDIVWSIEGAPSGVTVDANTGTVSAATDAEPGNVVLKATQAETGFETKYVINVSN